MDPDVLDLSINQITDVLDLSTILSTHGNEDAAHQPYLIAALLDWKNGGGGNIAPAPTAPKPVAQQDHSAAEDAAATAEAKAVAAQAKTPPARKAAPAKAAKGRAKPPMVGTRDDNEPSPDPSADDADF